MPARQIASVDNYDFGAPAVEAEVLQFEVLIGGKLALTFVNEGESDLEVTVQVSADGSSWADTTAGNNLVAVANETIIPKTNKDYAIIARADVDLYLRVQAVDGVHGSLQVRPDAALRAINI